MISLPLTFPPPPLHRDMIESKLTRIDLRNRQTTGNLTYRLSFPVCCMFRFPCFVFAAKAPIILALALSLSCSLYLSSIDKSLNDKILICYYYLVSFVRYSTLLPVTCHHQSRN